MNLTQTDAFNYITNCVKTKNLLCNGKCVLSLPISTGVTRVNTHYETTFLMETIDCFRILHLGIQQTPL